MAIFEDNRELSRQERYIGMSKVKGFKKGALAVMGYKDTGERNAWGRTGIAGTLGMATAGGSRLLAKSLAKGTDANKVMKKTDDEWLSTGMAKGKFMYESAKLTAKLMGMAAGGGVGGGVGDVGGGDIGSMGSDLATAGVGDVGGGIDTVGGDLGGDIISSGGSSLVSEASDISTSTAGEQLSKQVSGMGTQIAKDESISEAERITGNKTDSELLQGMDEEAVSEDGEELTEEELTEEEKRKEKEKKEKREKRNKMLSKVPLVGGVASSGLELIAAQKNYTQEAKKEAQVFKEMTAKDSQFNLL